MEDTISKIPAAKEYTIKIPAAKEYAVKGFHEKKGSSGYKVINWTF